MDREQKYETLRELKDKLDKVKAELKRQPGNIKLRMKRDKIRLEIKETKLLFTDEDFQEMMESRGEINVSRING
jgi:hypothetical protein